MKGSREKRLGCIILFFVWLANLKGTARLLLLVNSPVTLILIFFLQSCRTRGREPRFPAICTAYNAAGGAPATICTFCVHVFCAATVVVAHFGRLTSGTMAQLNREALFPPLLRRSLHSAGAGSVTAPRFCQRQSVTGGGKISRATLDLVEQVQ